MDSYESNCIVLRAILGSRLSTMNTLIPLWNVGILLPEKEVDYSLSSMLNLKINELKQILKLCGILPIKDNNIKFVIDTSGHGGKYRRSIFYLENSILVNYFAKISVARFNKHQRNMHCIGLGYDHETKINSSSQFNYKNHISVRN